MIIKTIDSLLAYLEGQTDPLDPEKFYSTIGEIDNLIKNGRFIEVEYIEDHPPVISGIWGGFDLSALEGLSEDIEQNAPEMFNEEGFYAYSVKWYESQYDSGQCVFPPGFELDLIGYEPIKKEDK